MNPDSTTLLRRLLRERRVAALGTLQDDGAPSVSMVPFALLDDERSLAIHVSGLAAHTRQLLRSPRVGLMVVDADAPDADPLALGRISIQGEARLLEAGDPSHAAAKARYLAKFPQASDLFDFPDFRLVSVRFDELRLVAGFGRAHSLPVDELPRLLAG